MFKFSVITPTIVREGLLRSCRHLDNQTYQNFEHIVVVDKKSKDITDRQSEILEIIAENPNRKIILLDENYNNFGNTPRKIAFDYVTGDYITYNDDDDYFVENAFELINKELEKVNAPAVVYPCKRYGHRFFNLPPASCMTVTGQYMHKPVIDGEEMKWIDFVEKDGEGYQGYTYDGLFVNKIRDKCSFTPICKDKILYIVPKSLSGQYD